MFFPQPRDRVRSDLIHPTPHLTNYPPFSFLHHKSPIWSQTTVRSSVHITFPLPPHTWVREKVEQSVFLPSSSLSLSVLDLSEKGRADSRWDLNSVARKGENRWCGQWNGRREDWRGEDWRRDMAPGIAPAGSWAEAYRGMSADNVKGLVLALSSSFFIGASFIIKKKGLKKAGASGVRAGIVSCKIPCSFGLHFSFGEHFLSV